MKFFLTTAIDYVNSRPHLGTAYEKIAADVVARYKRLAGFETHFLMGNDEHSQNVFRKARELGEEPLAYCDRMAREFIEVWRQLDISFDDFIRTTEPRHKAGVQELVRRMSAAGDIYEGHYGARSPGGRTSAGSRRSATGSATTCWGRSPGSASS
jgi:methionyl-tRNA synthetase